GRIELDARPDGGLRAGPNLGRAVHHRRWWRAVCARLQPGARPLHQEPLLRRNDYPPAISEAGVLRDGLLVTGRGIRKQFADASCKARHVLSVEFGAPLGLALTTARTHFTIG